MIKELAEHHCATLSTAICDDLADQQVTRISLRASGLCLLFSRPCDCATGLGCITFCARQACAIWRLLPEVSHSLARPTLVDCFLERPAKNQNDEDQRSPQHDDLPLGDCASRTDTGGHSDAGRCRQPVDVMTFAISDNNTCAQKTDSGHDALDNAAGVGAGDGVDG